MEQELYSFPLSTTAFKSAISLTERHFGIDTGYFLNEIERLSSWPDSINCDSPYEAALESEEDLQLFIPFNPQCLIDIFKQLDSTKSDIDFINAMILVTLIVYPNGSGDRIVNLLYNEWQETVEEYVKYDAVRADMAVKKQISLTSWVQTLISTLMESSVIRWALMQLANVQVN